MERNLSCKYFGVTSVFKKRGGKDRVEEKETEKGERKKKENSKQIHYLESTNKLDLTGKNQHGFKCNKSTATAGALLQSIIEHVY